MRNYAILLTFLLATSLHAQDDNKFVVTGSVQSDVLIPEEDKAIGATKDGDWAKVEAAGLTFGPFQLKLDNNAAQVKQDAFVKGLDWY